MVWTPPSGKGFVERFCKVVGCSHMSGRPETVISRLKHVIGSRLRSHTDERRATEVGVAVQGPCHVMTGRRDEPSAGPYQAETLAALRQASNASARKRR